MSAPSPAALRRASASPGGRGYCSEAEAIMDFGLSEEQQQLKESARAFLSGECPTTVVRKIMALEDGYPREIYAEMAKLGWCGLIVPEESGGAGLGLLDMAMLLE